MSSKEYEENGYTHNMDFANHLTNIMVHILHEVGAELKVPFRPFILNAYESP